MEARESQKINCPICHFMGTHTEDCPNYPKEWRDCQHEVYEWDSPNKPKNYAGHCIKCGMAIY